MIVYETSVPGLVGDRAVKEREVMGKVSGLGFPARRDIIFGRFSRGNRLRTVLNIQPTKKHQGILGILGLGRRSLNEENGKEDVSCCNTRICLG